MHLIKVLLNPINNHLTGDEIFTAYGYDNVSVSLARLYKGFVLQASTFRGGVRCNLTEGSIVLL